MTTRDDREKDAPQNQTPTEETTPPDATLENVNSPYWLNRPARTTNADVNRSIAAPQPVPTPVEDRKDKKNWKLALFIELMIQTTKLLSPESAVEQGADGTSISKSLPAPEIGAKRYVAVGTTGPSEASEEADRFWTAVGPVIDAVAKEQPHPPESMIHEAKEYVKDMAKGAGAEFKDAKKLGHRVGGGAGDELGKRSMEELITLTVAAWEARKLKKGGEEKKNEILSRSGEICERADELLDSNPELTASDIAERTGCSQETAEAVKKLLEEMRGDSSRTAKA